MTRPFYVAAVSGVGAAALVVNRISRDEFEAVLALTALISALATLVIVDRLRSKERAD